jgi:hypothetical protein
MVSRDGFKKRAIFNIAPSLSNADFVFLCITEYKENVKAKVLLNVLFNRIEARRFSIQSSRLDQASEFGPVAKYAICEGPR